MEDTYINLKNSFEKVLSEYGGIYDKVVENNDWKNPFRNIISKDIPAIIKKCLNLNSTYQVVGSYGKGRWTSVPWIAIFDSRITTSAQRGVYIVYLINKDTKELFLTLNQGATSVIDRNSDNKEKHVFVGVAGQSNTKNIAALKENAKTIRNTIDGRGFDNDESINTGSVNYDAGSIYYKKYSLDSFPSGKDLVEDLRHMLAIYSDYEKNYYEKNESSVWWPSLTEYDPSINKEQWLEILNKPGVIDAAWGGVLSMFYDFGGEATCKQLSLKYGWEASSISGSCTQFAKYVHKTTGCKLYTDNEKDRYWPILFQGKDASKNEPGGFVWKLRPELKDALKEYDILRFLPKKDSNKPMDVKTVKETLEHIKDYIASRGFSYDDGLIENFYLSLKSKPFVILAGTSGTGKTKLVKLFAEAIGARTGKEYKMVAVRPDWSDSSDLFGHVNLNGKFVAGEILDFIKEASENPEKPYILCLDEMNLARVEYYFSDFLSIIETREYKENGIISDCLVSKEKYGTDNEAVSKYGELQFPSNLYIVGTVNMDETTFPFSKKVLDRANTIEFDYVNLIPNEFSTEVVESLDLPNDFLKTKYLLLSQCADFEYVKGISEKLEDINKILRKANAHVGYRVRDEISFYMLNNKEAGLLKEDVAFDYEIMQKILPRIQGSASSVRELLVDLFKYCCGSNDGIDSDATDYVNTVESMASNAKYKMSAKKLSYMIKRYEDDGFTSYWL